MATIPNRAANAPALPVNKLQVGLASRERKNTNTKGKIALPAAPRAAMYPTDPGMSSGARIRPARLIVIGYIGPRRAPMIATTIAFSTRESTNQIVNSSLLVKMKHYLQTKINRIYPSASKAYRKIARYSPTYRTDQLATTFGSKG